MQMSRSFRGKAQKTIRSCTGSGIRSYRSSILWKGMCSATILAQISSRVSGDRSGFGEMVWLEILPSFLDSSRDWSRLDVPVPTDRLDLPDNRIRFEARGGETSWSLFMWDIFLLAILTFFRKKKTFSLHYKNTRPSYYRIGGVVNAVFANNYHTFAQLCFKNFGCKAWVAKTEHLKKNIIVNFFFLLIHFLQKLSRESTKNLASQAVPLRLACDKCLLLISLVRARVCAPASQQSNNPCFVCNKKAGCVCPTAHNALNGRKRGGEEWVGGSAFRQTWRWIDEKKADEASRGRGCSNFFPPFCVCVMLHAPSTVNFWTVNPAGDKWFFQIVYRG